LPEGWREARLEASLFPRLATPARKQPAARSLPAVAAIHERLRQHRHVTLQLLVGGVPAGQPVVHPGGMVGLPCFIRMVDSFGALFHGTWRSTF